MRKAIERLLIANRGEIAARIIRTAKRLGIHTIAVCSDADRNTLHTSLADEVWPLKSNDLAQSYLNIPKLIEIARLSHADALHPGYGFLAENPELVRACEAAGIIFVGPGPEAMRLMGNKIHAREFVRSTGVPLIEGFTGSAEDLLAQAVEHGFPYLVKAAAGGGGKGMRIAYNHNELKEHLESTSREALNYFGDGTVYLERFLEQPRHIEIQILADSHGNAVHLFERECSVQRRYQKIIEEAPSPTVDPELRSMMGGAAVSIAKAISYAGAGTMEFLVDKHLNYHFLEMNTRIQVEHPVTEMITGVDIVEEQIRIAEGLPLSFRQEDISFSGHAIEFRVYAEDPFQEFMPSPGWISCYVEPRGQGIRVDAALDAPAEIHGFYDPMISKLVVHAKDREGAIRKGKEAIVDYAVHGIKTNLPLLHHFTTLDDFKENRVHTKYCDINYDSLKAGMTAARDELAGFPVIASYLACQFLCFDFMPANTWEEIGYWRNIMEIPLSIDGKQVRVKIHGHSKSLIELSVEGLHCEASIISTVLTDIQILIGQRHYRSMISGDGGSGCHLSMEGQSFEIVRLDELRQEDFYIPPENIGLSNGGITSPMPGKILKVNISAGDSVKKGQILLVVEAMKMENNILAPRDGVVQEVSVVQGDMVDTKRHLVLLENIES